MAEQTSCGLPCMPRMAWSVQGRVPGRTGVWTGERKIAAVGVQISHGVTRHGAAVNVATDLSWYDSIIPCGIEDKEVTSVSRELGRDVPVHDVAAVLSEAFMQHFGYSRHEMVSQESMQQMTDAL